MSTTTQPASATPTTLPAATPPDPTGAGLDAGDGIALLVIVPLVVVAVALALRARVFRRNSIMGPPRLAADESPGLLLLGFGGGFLIWIFAQVLLLAPAVAAPAPSTSPATTQATATAAVAGTPEIPPARMALVSTVPALIAGAFVITANVALRRNGLERLGLTTSQLKRGIKAGIFGCVITIPLVFMAAVLTQLLWQLVHYQHPKEHELLRQMSQSPSRIVTAVLILSATVVAPVWEELLFRGHLQTLIAYGLARLFDKPSRRGFDVVSPATADVLQYAQGGSFFPTREDAAPWMRWAAVLVTSLAFAAVHPKWTIPPIFFLSVCLGYAYERTGNLWATMLMHAGFNTTSTLIYLFLVH
jgi:membrane protease YdiL (CAAX protease family)